MVYIPGTKNLYIDLKGNIYDYNGVKLEYNISNRTVVINMFSKDIKVSLDWLISVSYYRIPSEFLKLYKNNIEFKIIKNTVLKIPTGTIMVFKEPIYHCDGFRIIPSYHRYAINKDGVLMDRYSGVIKNPGKNSDGYMVYNIIDPCKGKSKTIPQHRLIANAFIPNDNYVKRPYINHIDGNKSNNSIDNLEWCSEEENAIHAATIGLNKSNIALKCRNVYTGEITIFNSLNQIVKELNIPYSRISLFKVSTGRLPGYLFNKKYEVKTLEDNSPWYYENDNLDKSSIGKRAHITIKVTNKENGETKIFNNTKKVNDYYKCRLPSINCEDLKSNIEKRYNNLSVEIIRNSLNGPYRIYNIINKTLINTVNSLDVMKDLIGIGRNMIRDDLFKGKKYIYNEKYIVAPVSIGDINFSDYIKRPDYTLKVSIINKDTKEVKTFNSIRQMSIFFNIDKSAGLKLYNNQKEYRGYLIRPI